MKTLLMVLAMLCPVSALAATLTWDRNTEADLMEYRVWACFTPGCVVTKTSANLQAGSVAQTAVGTKPTYTIASEGKAGAVAVSARDSSLNESGISVQVNFTDLLPPLPPANPTLQ